jgi:hypothetical protein
MMEDGVLEPQKEGGSDSEHHGLLIAMNKLMNDNLDKFKMAILEEMKKTTDSLISKVDELSRENIEMKDQMKKMEVKQHEYEQTINSLRDDIRHNKAHAIRNEQYSRRCSIKILGIPEEERGTVENCDEKVVEVINKYMMVEVTTEDIEVAHRVKSWTSKEGARSMVVRFRAKEKRQEVINQRGRLKDTVYKVVEDVCKDIILYLNRLRNYSLVKQAWYWAGKIYVKDQQDHVEPVEYGLSCNDLFGK